MGGPVTFRNLSSRTGMRSTINLRQVSTIWRVYRKKDSHHVASNNRCSRSSGFGRMRGRSGSVWLPGVWLPGVWLRPGLRRGPADRGERWLGLGMARWTGIRSSLVAARADLTRPGRFSATLPDWCLEQPEQQFRNLFGFFLLYPMTGAFQKMATNQVGADNVAHPLQIARRLMHAPVAGTGHEQ
jgi:hypothetical protein